MPNPNITRSDILRSSIDALFAQPNKKTLKQGEALCILAKLDGRKNDNVIETKIATKPAKDQSYASVLTPGNDWCFHEGHETRRVVAEADWIFERELEKFDHFTQVGSDHVTVALHAEALLTSMARIFAAPAFGACLTRTYDVPNACARARLHAHIDARFGTDFLERAIAAMPRDVEDKDIELQDILAYAGMAAEMAVPAGYQLVRYWPWQLDGRTDGRSIASDNNMAEAALTASAKTVLDMVASGTTLDFAVWRTVSTVGPDLQRDLSSGFEAHDATRFAELLTETCLGRIETN